MTDALAGFDPFTLPLSGMRFVEASAGTGKTYSIKLLYLRALVELELRPREILVVTFTRAATAELRERLRSAVVDAHAALRRVLDAPDELPGSEFDRWITEHPSATARRRAMEWLERAVEEFDTASIFTLDGFGQRALSAHALVAGTPLSTEVLAQDDDVRERATLDAYLALARALEGGVPAFGLETAQDLASLAVREPAVQLEPAMPDVVALGAAFDSAREVYRLARGDAAVEVVGQSIRDAGHRRHAKTLAAALAVLDTLAATGDCSVKLTEETRSLGAGYVKPERAAPSLLELLTACERLSTTSAALQVGRTLDQAHRLVVDVRRRYEAATTGQGVYTFARMLDALARALDAEGTGAALADVLAEQFRCAFVDECQDTNLVQLSIVRRITAERGRPLVFIGDPKQAIYGFRGADLDAYVGARSQAAETTTMRRNFRSRAELLDVLNALYKTAQAPFVRTDVAYVEVQAGKPAESVPRLVDPATDAAVDVLCAEVTSTPAARLAARDIARLLAEASILLGDAPPRPVRPSDVVVVCTRNADVAATVRALRRLGVPAVSSTQSAVTRAPEAAELVAMLRAAAMPSDARALRTALFGRLEGYDAAAVDALERDDARAADVVARYARLGREAHTLGSGAALLAHLRRIGAEVRLLRRPDGYRRITDLLHVVELLVGREAEGRLDPESAARWLASAIAEGGGDDARALRMEHSGDVVRVMTVHVSKGLEFPVVYCVGLEAGTKPPSAPITLGRPGQARALWVHMEPGDAATADAFAAACAERARLVYVALTRAASALRIVVAPKRVNKALPGIGGSGLGPLLVPGLPPTDPKQTADVVRAALTERSAALAERGLPTFSVRTATNPAVEPARPIAATAAPLPPAPCVRRFDDAARTTSFSALLDGHDVGRGSRDVDRGRRSDEGLEEGLRSADTDPLAAAPPGAALGTLVHDVLETLDFDADEATIAQAVDAALRYAPAFAPHAAGLCAAVRRTLQHPLLPSGLRLCDLPRSRTVRELEFQVSVAKPAVSPARIAEVFRAHGVPAGLPDVPARIEALSFEAFHGMLRGFVDLVFVDGERHHVVDYKTNRLDRGYGPEALRGSVADHHYALQYALYTVAVHRLLRARLPSYDYDRHVGEVLYLYVRGLCDPARPTDGVHRERLPRGFVEALDRLLAGEEAS